MDSISKSMSTNNTKSTTPSNSPSKHSPTTSVLTPQPNNNYQIVRPNAFTDDTEIHNKWEHYILSYIFHVELRSDKSNTATTATGRQNTPPSSRQRTLLSDLSNDTQYITHDLIDSLIVERLNLPFNNVIATESQSIQLTYLMQCYRRSNDLFDSIASMSSIINKSYYPTTDTERQLCYDCINTALTTCVNYSAMCMSDNGIIDAPEHAINELYRLLSIDSKYNTRTGLPHNYLLGLSKTDDASTIFKIIVEKLKQNIIKIQYEPDYDKQFDAVQQLLIILINLTLYKSICNILVDHQSFIPVAMNGRQFQQQHLFGILLGCATPPSLPQFQNPMTRPGSEVIDTINTQRSVYNIYQQQLCIIFDQLVKADKHSRERTLQLLSIIITLNSSRAKMHYNQQTVATTPYMYNISIIMLHLCMPIVDDQQYLKKIKLRSPDAVHDATIKQYNKIALSYYLNSTGSRLSYDGVTRIGATPNDIALYRESNDTTQQYTFTTECIAITHQCMHIGLLPITVLYLKIQERFQELNHDIQSYPHGTPQYTMIDMERNSIASQVLSLRVHLDDQAIIQPLIILYNFTAAYISYTVLTSKPLALIIPESLVEDTIEFYTFIARFQPEQFKELYLGSTGKLDGLFDMMLRLGYGNDKLTNFHLRGKFAELLYLMLPHSKTDDILSESHVFYTNQSLQSGLIPLLIDLFIEVEYGTNQFYSKFTSRYYIAELIKHLYTIPTHKQNLISTLSNIDYAVKLLNAVANDVIFLLDDALKSLSEIRELESQQDNGMWNNISADELKTKQKKLKDAERSAKSTMNLGNAIVHMLYYLTIDIVEPFVSDVMVERIATIITYYIDKLIGSTVQDLKVKNKDKYSFQPRILLSEIIQIFIHLSVSDEFLHKIAADERSYSNEIWMKAARTLRKRAILPESTIQQFEALSVRVAEINESISNLDDILGDIPDEYSDALIGTIMTHPVLLPSSKTIVDKSTIQRHLMNTPSDPFNRAPLTIDQCTPQPELESKIKQWVEQRKKEYKDEKRRELLNKHENETAELAAKAKQNDSDDSRNNTTNNTANDIVDTDMTNNHTQ